MNYDEDYYERGPETGKSLYSNYRWIPELTLPMAATICEQLGVREGESVLDFGCAKGYLVKALRLLYREAWGYDRSEYALRNTPRDVANYCQDNLNPPMPERFDWIFAKDVLEHIEEDTLVDVLRVLHLKSDKLFVVVPLGVDGKYVVPAYEHDITHQIRRPLEWWSAQLQSSGFTVQKADYLMPHVKSNWAEFKTGNGFFVCA